MTETNTAVIPAQAGIQDNEREALQSNLDPLSFNLAPNYCNAAQECTAPAFTDEKHCRFFTPSMFFYASGGCILRTWFYGCLNPAAMVAAKEQALLARTAIAAATTEHHSGEGRNPGE